MEFTKLTPTRQKCHDPEFLQNGNVTAISAHEGHIHSTEVQANMTQLGFTQLRRPKKKKNRK
jgi:hypothetical protein